MSVKLKGDKELTRTLEQLYGKRGMLDITDKALIKGANKVVEILKQDMASFADTGKTVKATNVSKPMTVGGVRTVKINWQDKSERHYIIHLNEYGHYDRSGKWINTDGKGVIENAMRRGRDVYFSTVKKEMARR